MLKITYLEDGIYLEYLEESVASWKATRILVSLRAGASIYEESNIACLLFPLDIPYLGDLIELAEQGLISLNPCDDQSIEISLSGTWLATSKDSEEGVFVCDLPRSNERFVCKLWQESLTSSICCE